MHASYVSMILEDAENIWQFLKQSQSQCQEIKFLKQPTFFSLVAHLRFSILA